MNELLGNVEMFYQNFYKKCLRSGFVGKAQDKTHRMMESQFTEKNFFPNVLEVGSGFGDHFPFVRHRFNHYLQTDIREFKENGSQVSDAKSCSFQVADVMNLQFQENTFDRSIATCLLLHLPEPELALQELRRVTVKSGGKITLLVPCEPGLLLRFTRMVITSKKAKRLGFKGYNLFNARDHVTYFLRIHRLIKHVFKDDSIKIQRKPFLIPSWNLNFYFVYHVTLGPRE